MRLGIVTYMIGAEMDLETLLDLCVQSGVEGVELRTTHKHGVEVTLDAAQRSEVRKKIEDSGVVLWGLGTACEYHSTDEAEVRSNVELTKEFVKLAVEVGARGVKVRPNGLQEAAGVPKEKTLEQIGLAYRECGVFGQEHGIELWMEVHGRGSSDPRNMKTIIDAADHPNCLVCWNCNGGDIDENGSIRWGLEPLKDKVASCHLHDLIDEKYPWLELFSILRDAGYGDRFTLTEMAASPEPVRLMKYYRLLWQELVSKQA